MAESVICLFFGCWNQPGHFLVGVGGSRAPLSNEQACFLSNHLDSMFAPKLSRSGKIVFGDTRDHQQWDRYDASECPQGQFLRHRFHGYTLLQWWDRCQGDKRGACNSTILLEGEHTTEEMLSALRSYFPHVIANLEKEGVSLVEVHAEA